MIPKHVRQNFDTLVQAVKNDDVCLMECRLRATGEPVYVLCAVMKVGDGEIETIPFGQMAGDNPYEQYISPKEDESTNAGAEPAEGDSDGDDVQ